MSTNTFVSASATRAFAFLKKNTSPSELLVKHLPIGRDMGYLLPVTQIQLMDSKALESLWAEADAFSGLNSFGRSCALKEILNTCVNQSEYLGFVVYDQLNRLAALIGPISIEHSVNRLRIHGLFVGDAQANKTLVLTSLTTISDWARTTIGTEETILSCNNDAISSALLKDQKTLLKYNGNGALQETERLESLNASRATSSHYSVSAESSPDSVILTAGPSISEREAAYAWDAARNGWNNQWAHYLDKLQNKFADYIGARFCLATSSCTGALHIALTALDIGPGDEVIVPDVTWVATANVVRYVGATPVFADIEEHTWCLDPKSLEGKITSRTRAVIPVHLYGHPTNMTAIMEIAKRHKLFVVEDAAPAIGASWSNQRVGTFGDFACFSFQGAKLLVTGEGGALVTKDKSLYERALKVWDQGRNPKKTFWIDAHGLKYKMSNVQAAVGLAQIERCEEQIEMKRRIFSWYENALSECSHVKMMPEAPSARSIYWMSNCQVRETCRIDREQLRAELKSKGIDTRPVFPAISQYPIWGTSHDPAPVALRVGNTGINLPSGVCLTRKEVERVCRTIIEITK